MSNNESKGGWFSDFVAGFFSLISIGKPKVDHYIQMMIKLLVLFLIMSVLLFTAGSALVDWIGLLGIDTASEAVGAAFSEAVQQSLPAATEVPEVPVDVPAVPVTE